MQLNKSERFVGRWSDWEQLDVIPPTRRARYNETLFGKLGRCRDHPAVASQLYSYPTAQDKTQIREPKPTKPEPEPEPEPELTSSCFAVRRDIRLHRVLLPQRLVDGQRRHLRP